MSDTRPRAEIGHVVLTDRVGYSMLSLEHKLKLDQELLEAVRNCPAVTAARPQDVLLTDSGDGVSMIFFNDPVPAAESALYVFRRVARNAQIRLRMGIHSGPVIRRIDASGGENVTGPGIEKAQRTMNQSDGSTVMVSEFFAENLRAFGNWSKLLIDKGEHIVKHGEKLRLYALSDEDPLAGAPEVALLCRRNSEPEESLLSSLAEELSAKGVALFIDRHQGIGVEWAQQVDRRIRQAAVVVALLSERSSGSEMLQYELQIAFEEFEKKGFPRVLPVQVGEAPVTGDLAALVSRFAGGGWQGLTGAESLCAEVMTLLSRPEDPVGTEAAETPPPLEPAGGAVPLESKFYVVRETDREFQKAMTGRDSIVLVKGGRQMGKTSLLARSLGIAAAAGAQIVLTDFQSFGASQLQSDERLYRSLAYEFASQMNFPVDPQAGWNEWLGPNSNFEQFLQNQVLRKATGHVIWAMDEVDRLFPFPFATDFFGLIRSWYNRRALRPDDPWSKLTIAIAYATEAHLFITDLNQSPFNVGTRLTLNDFSAEQVSELNLRYGQPLRGSEELSRFHRLTGGQPYLCRRGLDELVRRSIPFTELESIADQEEGPFGDHLRRLLIGVSNDPALLKDTQAVLHGAGAPSVDGFYRLRSAGVFVGDSAPTAKMRCELYRTYLLRHSL